MDTATAVRLAELALLDAQGAYDSTTPEYQWEALNRLTQCADDLRVARERETTEELWAQLLQDERACNGDGLLARVAP